MAVKEKPDLVISDVMMPRISGFDMLDILRNAPETKETKVIMMTALSQAEDKARADKLGADRYLVKSQVTLEDVAKVVREVLGLDDEQPASTAQATPLVDPLAEATASLIQQTPPSTPASPAATQPTAPEPTGAPLPPPPVPLPNDAISTATTPAPAATANPDPASTPAPSLSQSSTTPAANPAAATNLDDPAATAQTAPPANSTGPTVTSLQAPDLAAAEALLTPSPPTTPTGQVTEQTPGTVTAPPDQPMSQSSAQSPAQEFIGPSLEQALASEEGSASNQAPAGSPATTSQAPTIMNGVNQSGITTPSAQNPMQPPTPPAGQPVVITPTNPPPTSAPTTTPPANSLLDEDNPRKKVIQPIHDPRAKPDFDALLAREEQRAAAVNPSAGTSIRPALPTSPADGSSQPGSQPNDIAI